MGRSRDHQYNHMRNEEMGAMPLAREYLTAEDWQERWPLLAGRPLLDGKPTAYVCRNRLCKLPANTPAQLSVQPDKLVSQAPAP